MFKSSKCLEFFVSMCKSVNRFGTGVHSETVREAVDRLCTLGTFALCCLLLTVTFNYQRLLMAMLENVERSARQEKR